MGIKEFRNNIELVNLLGKRKLANYNNRDILSLLKRKNYFMLFNGLETLLLENKTVKIYNGESIEDFIRLYKFDQEFSMIILSIIHNFELHLKTSIAYIFAQNNCSIKKDTMNYTDISYYRDLRRTLFNSITNFIELFMLCS